MPFGFYSFYKNIYKQMYTIVPPFKYLMRPTYCVTPRPDKSYAYITLIFSTHRAYFLNIFFKFYILITFKAL
jgi:hypothetical protein